MKKVAIWACALVLVSLIALAGCGGGSSSSGGGDTPEDTVKAFLDANIAMDVDALWDTLSKDSQKGLDKKQMEASAAQQDKNTQATYTYKLGKSKIDGDTATVEATLSQGEQSYPVTFQLVKEGGTWKVDFMKTFGASQTGTETTPSSSGTAPSQ